MHVTETDFVEYINKYAVQDYKIFFGKRVLLRVDWNLPTKNGEILDKTRATSTFPFIRKLSEAGAKIVILSHFGEKGESIEPVAKYICKELPFVKFTKTFEFEDLKKESLLIKNGGAILLENVRMWDGETECLQTLSTSFASLGEIFINNAFSVSHRNHSSIVGVAKILRSYLGPTCINEIINLHKILNPALPSLLIIGGAKISTKLPLIKHYLDLGVNVFVGGAMVHNIWKDRGLSIGNSLFDKNYITPENILNAKNLFTPTDVILNDGKHIQNNEIPRNGVVVDLGQESVDLISSLSMNAKTIILNGPLGLYEDGWLGGTEKILTTISNSGADTYIGGGDTITVAQSLNILNKFTFVSLGGGAMLDFLSSGTLVGIDAVTKQ